MKFRKKPVVIEAWQIDGSDPVGTALIRDRCDGRMFRIANGEFAIDIPTLEGVMRASHGDWIIKGVKGEFYPCKPDIFAATYEPADHEGYL